MQALNDHSFQCYSLDDIGSGQAALQQSPNGWLVMQFLSWYQKAMYCFAKLFSYDNNPLKSN
jgi:hypothetical protein